MVCTPHSVIPHEVSRTARELVGPGVEVAVRSAEDTLHRQVVPAEVKSFLGVVVVVDVSGGQVEHMCVVEECALIVSCRAGVNFSAFVDPGVDLPSAGVVEISPDPGVNLLALLEVSLVMRALVNHASNLPEAIICQSLLGRLLGRVLPLTILGVLFPDPATVVLRVPATTEGVVEPVFGCLQEACVASHLVAADEREGEPADVVVPSIPAPWRRGEF